ncbi:YfiT family bacillithiol transferase [Pedobacter sp. SYSU D00535]|uniref:YfiT family bacillithiol transferase n=1 Tax=Pedobacter sp. SYSU D00535 TaxID=2810308 RepID=UPI001A971337|nr:putative metal-dependent hydrolase [Pedobacter sp. SYSU D00535]
MKANQNALRYPIGEFSAPADITGEQIKNWIDEIAALPEELEKAADGLSDTQLNTPYRPGGWTLRQVIHHLPDSHMNSYIRFKLAITEDSPTIRPYLEDRWAECEEARTAAPDVSINLLKDLHKRWVLFLRSLQPADFEKGFIHPEQGKLLKLKEVLGSYAWHGKHHLHHILQTRQLNGW